MIVGPPSGPRDPRVSILYFSGAGGTKLVAELLGEILSESVGGRVTGIEDSLALGQAAGSDLLVLCYPTYYLEPPPSMREFAERLGPFDPSRKAYLVTTCELYSENSIRGFALMLRKRGYSSRAQRSFTRPEATRPASSRAPSFPGYIASRRGCRTSCGRSRMKSGP